MARGWESKEIESQIEAAEQRQEAARRAHMSKEDLERMRRRESLQLSRTRVLHDLDAATHPRRREQLESALEHLDRQLAALDAE